MKINLLKGSDDAFCINSNIWRVGGENIRQEYRHLKLRLIQPLSVY